MEAEDLGCVEGDWRRELVDGGGAGAVELDVAAEVLGARGEAVGEEMDELGLSAREKGVVGAALLADGGGALGTHLAAAERAGSVGGEDLGVVGELEEFFVEALVEHRCKFLRAVVAGEIGAADVADEEGVSGEDGSRGCGLGEVGEDGADAFDGVAGGVEEVETGVAELEGIAFFDRGMGEGGVGVLAEIDAGVGALGEFVVAGDEVGVEMGLDDVLDAETLLAGEVEVEVYIALWVDDGGYAFGGHDVGGVGEAAEEELLDEYGFHVFPLGAVYWKAVVRCQSSVLM